MAIFKRDEANNLSSERNIDEVHTILGKESAFEGKLAFKGTVRIDGRFKGEIRTENFVVVGQGARVDAQITVGSIDITGEVTGDITAKNSVEIHAAGKLRGNMSTPQLMIDKGAIFEGSCRMEEAQSSKRTAPPTLLSNHEKDAP